MAFDIFITTKYFIVYSLLHVLFDSWISLLSKLVILIENWEKNHRILKQEIFEFCMLFRFSHYEFLHIAFVHKKAGLSKKAYSAYNVTNHIIICINKPYNSLQIEFFMRLETIQAF